jgi:hypothetical protein
MTEEEILKMPKRLTFHGHPLADAQGIVKRHRLVLWNAGFDPRGKDVHHINGDHDDDRLNNLFILTAEEHRRLHMLGELSPAAKLNPAKVREIRRRFAAGDVSKTQLARELGTTRQNVRHIVTRETWKHVSQ